jgi:ferric-chelate reductase (NADPH)
MPSAKAVLGNVLGRFLFREATVAHVEDLTPRFRRVILEGQPLQAVRWTAGDKVQVFLPDIGMRTYTPTRWDVQRGETELVVYRHGDAPGTRWAGALGSRERVQLFGPRASLSLASGAHAIVVGDETSLGLALANGTNERAILEANDAAELRTVGQQLGLTNLTVVQRGGGDEHLPELFSAVESALQQRSAPLVLSGRATAIQSLRRGLKSRAVSPPDVRAKAYWAPGKVGLD